MTRRYDRNTVKVQVVLYREGKNDNNVKITVIKINRGIRKATLGDAVRNLLDVNIRKVSI